MGTVFKLRILLATILLHEVCCGPLQVVWMVPARSHEHTNFEYNASSSVAALALGLETIEKEGILPSHALNITYLDTDCNSKQSLGKLVDLLFVQAVDVVIGPPCSEVVTPIGELMSYRNIAMMNWVSLGQTITYKTDLTTYFRTMAPITSLGGIMMMFYYYTGWRQFVIISSEGDDYRSGADTITYSLKQHSLTGFKVVHHYEEVRIRASNADIDSILRSIIHEARVIILLIPRDELRRFMLRASYLGMTNGDYQFLFTDTQLAGADDVDLLNSDRLWRAGDPYDSIAQQAFQNVLYFVLGHNTKDTSAWREDAMTAYTRMFADRPDMPHPSEPDEFSAYLHDTIVYYAKLVNHSIAINQTIGGDLLLDLSGTTSINFKGLSGDVIMNRLGDRQPAFLIYDMDSTGNFHQVASLQYALSDTPAGFTVNTTFTKIIWGDGQTTDDSYIPPDSPACGFFNELCENNDVVGSRLTG